MVAKTHTDDPFWKFRDQPQEKVAISACCWPRNPSDIAERLYRRRRTATLLFILLNKKICVHTHIFLLYYFLSKVQFSSGPDISHYLFPRHALSQS